MNPIQLRIYFPFSYYLQKDAQTGAPMTRPVPAAIESYRLAIEKEICSLGEDLGDVPVSSVLFTGGYMSLLAPDEFTRLLSAVHRSFTLSQEVEIAGVLFPGSLDMSLVSAYQSHKIGPLLFDVPSLLGRECEKYHLPNTLQALDQTIYLLENFHMGNFGFRIPIGIPGRDEGMWNHIFGEINHYQPAHIQFYSLKDQAQEHPSFEVIQEKLVDTGYRKIAPLTFTQAKEAPKFAAFDKKEYASVGLGAVTRLDGFETRNTADFKTYLRLCKDYRSLIVETKEIPAVK